MGSVPAPRALAQHGGAAARARPGRAPMRIRALLAAIACALLLCWSAVVLSGYQAASPLGYWLGVAGGICTLVVFLYPLRKRLTLMRRWGAARHWFVLHMVSGIAGPLVVVTHSGFRIGSINAGVALVSMLLVAASGILGRFIYLRVHRGLSGAHWTLRELQQRIGEADSALRSQLAFAPRVEQLLQGFHAQAAQRPTSFSGRWRAFFAVALQARRLRRRCRRELALVLQARAAGAGWRPDQLKRALARSSRLVDDHLEAVQRAAQLGAYERLLSLWHVAHVPLVWMLLLSAIAHVVAVHVY